jgi:hypothetical protein
MKSLNKFALVAPCGMNCGICMAYLRPKNKCPGCRGDDAGKPITRWQCKIKTCETFQNQNFRFCFQCQEFPCSRLKHLDKRYRTRYGMSMIQNLEHIRDFGIRKFVASERVRWLCPECGGTICVHRNYCYDCGHKISRQEEQDENT